VYKLYYQKEFFEATERFYTAESCDFMASTNNDIPAYLRKAEQRLEEETERGKLYLIDFSRPAFMQLCERVLVTQHKETILADFVRFLDERKLDDLKRLYRLFSRIPEGLTAIKTGFANYVERIGMAQVEAIAGSIIKDPRIYVETLIHVYRHHCVLVEGPFQGNNSFHINLSKACRSVINNNVVCKANKNMPKTAELLAKFTSVVLKKSFRTNNDEEMEQILDDIVSKRSPS
jgi:cullin 1